MGNETNFNPDILKQALAELQQLNNFVSTDPALKRVTSVSSINGDLTGLNAQDEGWQWLEQHISDIAGYIQGITTAITTESTNLQNRMQQSLTHLNGAEDTNKSGLDKSRQNIQSGGNR